MTQTNRFFRFLIGIILVFLVIYLGSKVNFIFDPVISFISIILVPLMLAAFFYYLLRPLVELMHKRKVNRSVAVLLIYLVIALILVGFILGIWPSLREQSLGFVENAPNLINMLTKQLKELEESGVLAQFLPEGTNVFTKVTEIIDQGLKLFTNYMSGLVSFFSSFVMVLFVSPIILFFMLKEGSKFGENIVNFMPRRFRDEGTDLMNEIDNSISGFIVGRVLTNVALGVLMYIGFLIIGLPYALLLTVVSVIMNFIPFIGAIVSSVPIVIIAFIEEPSMAIWALVIILVAQQIQDNLLAPYIMNKTLDIHPITTIVVVLVGGDIGGLIGMLLAIPFYMAVKIIVRRVYNVFFKDRWEKA
ncbi:AI-2E family transporter [Paenibacillus sp. Marseille-Q4541]|uniref:AI-2E family transporter n=1 Tax=Paenibacillus sp. Marseille-Q4541 TaxID=2831522 RepID=UPI001BA589AB|nr:AI-2E family transporter [Paenibacillus sp. Marseille-Q4541]